MLRRTYLAVGLMAALCQTTFAQTNEVNVYSYRQPFLIEPMFDAFTEQTGIEVNVVFAKKGLVERLKHEGRNSPADIILTVDIGRLSDAQAAGVTQSVDSDTLNSNIPAQFRESSGQWFGLTTRARILVASKERIGEDAPARYEDLADPKWKGRICSRSGKHVYNVKILLDNGGEIGLATVYRVLTQFEAAGLVKRHHFDGAQSVFELDEGQHHDHLVCLKCGKVVEFYDEGIERRQKEIAEERGFALKDHALILYGTCSRENCAGQD